MRTLLPARDLRSVKVQQSLRARWKQEIKRRPPSERERFLRSQEGIVALGAKMCHDLLREIARGRTFLLESVPGDAWLDAAFEHGAAFPPGRADAGTGHSVGMELSRVSTRCGVDRGDVCLWDGVR